MLFVNNSYKRNKERVHLWSPVKLKKKTDSNSAKYLFHIIHLLISKPSEPTSFSAEFNVYKKYKA